VEPLLTLVVLVLLVAVAVVVVRATLNVVTIHDYERGVRYRQGRLRGLVDPGTRVVLRQVDEIRLVDGRPSFLVLEGQEVLSSDGVAVRISLAAHFVVGDAVAAVTADQDYRRALYLLLQLGLREAVAGRTVDQLLAARPEIGPAVMATAAGPVSRIGIELLEVSVRDLMLPGELKRVFAAVVAARKDGEAALERARAETAALRSLANAGRMVEDNPGLLQLRIMQQLGETPGATVMIGMPDGVGPAARATRRGAGQSKGAREEG
jgi:regulator of protease activity HflC (stomatin/prohibitin superfamily)